MPTGTDAARPPPPDAGDPAAALPRFSQLRSGTALALWLYALLTSMPAAYYVASAAIPGSPFSWTAAQVYTQRDPLDGRLHHAEYLLQGLGVLLLLAAVLLVLLLWRRSLKATRLVGWLVVGHIALTHGVDLARLVRLDIYVKSVPPDWASYAASVMRWLGHALLPTAILCALYTRDAGRNHSRLTLQVTRLALIGLALGNLVGMPPWKLEWPSSPGSALAVWSGLGVYVMMQLLTALYAYGAWVFWRREVTEAARRMRRIAWLGVAIAIAMIPTLCGWYGATPALGVPWWTWLYCTTSLAYGLATAGLFAVLYWYWRPVANRTAVADIGGHAAVCRQCGYDLTGNVSGICPECGTPLPRTRSGGH